MAGDTTTKTLDAMSTETLTPATGTAADGGAETSGADRRAHRRLQPHEIANLGARLASGAEIRLIDLSRGGAQFETDRRFLPNSSIALRLVTPDSTFVVNGRVVRSRIVRLEQGGLGYNVAVAFQEVLKDVIAEAPPSAVAPADSQATPASVHDTVRLPMPPETAAAEPAAMADAAVEEADDASDVTDEERAAFEASVLDGSPMLMVTASVQQTGDELREMFNGNDW